MLDTQINRDTLAIENVLDTKVITGGRLWLAVAADIVDPTVILTSVEARRAVGRVQQVLNRVRSPEWKQQHGWTIPHVLRGHSRWQKIDTGSHTDNRTT